MKKILITGGSGMLAHDFIQLFSEKYTITALSSAVLDITNMHNIQEYISDNQPDLILNFAAYTNVDDAEDIGMKANYDVNALGVYNLAKISAEKNIDFITISSDYVFSGKAQKGYSENDKIIQPVNQYGMAKSLGEKLALMENLNTIIIRTSWLYGGGKMYKNFVNTMVALGNKLDSLKIINDQFGNPTHCKDLSLAIYQVIENIGIYRGKKLHLSNITDDHGITWSDFAKEIFTYKQINVKVIPCSSEDFPTKAKRPHYSKLINNSDVQLRDWKEGLRDYLDNI